MDLNFQFYQHSEAESDIPQDNIANILGAKKRTFLLITKIHMLIR